MQTGPITIPGYDNVSLVSGSGNSFWSNFGNILNSAGGAFANVWGALNSPTQQTLPGGGILQNGQVYYPQGTVTGSSGSIFLILIAGVIAVVLLRK